MQCGKSTANSAGRSTAQLKCTNECQIAKRNARLADALGINGQPRDRPIVYNDELTTFAKSNAKFIQLVEKTFAEYVDRS